MDAKQTVKITINGKSADVSADITISQLIEEKNLNPRRCVAEINGKAMPFAQFKDVKINDGDILEIMSVVAGG